MAVLHGVTRPSSTDSLTLLGLETWSQECADRNIKNMTGDPKPTPLSKISNMFHDMLCQDFETVTGQIIKQTNKQNKMKRNETKRNETKRNKTKQNETK